MPAVTIAYPRGFFDSMPEVKVQFKKVVKQSVASNMDAIDPKTEKVTHYGDDPNAFIDLVLVPYDPDDAEVTTPFLATIVSYDWIDRMATLKDRIKRITAAVRNCIPSNTQYGSGELISFTFLGKKPGAWSVA